MVPVCLNGRNAEEDMVLSQFESVSIQKLSSSWRIAELTSATKRTQKSVKPRLNLVESALIDFALFEVILCDKGYDCCIVWSKLSLQDRKFAAGLRVFP